MDKMNGAKTCLECLIKEGVKYIFGYPGAAIAPFYDALRECSSVRHILVRNEQNAGHAASGYARASGRVGVCCTTSGPGALNLMPALATAYMDSIPLVAITGQVSTEYIGRDVFQEADITGACEPFTKYSYLVKKVSELPKIIKEAFYIASTGRPGPVLIDLPIDVQLAELSGKLCYPDSVDIIGYKPRTKGHPLQIDRAVEAIAQSKRPLICAGGGVVSAEARKELSTLSEKLSIPVVSTLMGVGILPSEDKLYLGMLGSHGKAAANRAVSGADLLILCGARVGDRSLAAPDQTAKHARIIHIDIDTVEIGKNMPADIPIVGDVRLVLKELAAKSAPLDHTEWIEQTEEWKALDQENRVIEPDGLYVEPNAFMRTLSAVVNRTGKAVLVADVGQNQMWAANSFNFSGGRFLTSGGMGTMGYSVPAAMGAKLAKPSRWVIAVCGDGSFQMMLPELSTIAAENIPIKIIIMRNGVLGMVRELQDDSYDGRRFCVQLDGYPDVVELAHSYGIDAMRLSKNEDSERAIEWLLSEKKAAVLECVISPECDSRSGKTR